MLVDVVNSVGCGRQKSGTCFFALLTQAHGVCLPFVATPCYPASHDFDKLAAKPQKQTNGRFMHIRITATSAKT